LKNWITNGRTQVPHDDYIATEVLHYDDTATSPWRSRRRIAWPCH